MATRNYSGSSLLGTELRRLRGRRTLGEIAALSRSKPIADRVNPVSAPTLSQIENGITFPSLDTLHALATVYQVPVSRFHSVVMQERELDRHELPPTCEETLARYKICVEEGRWLEGLALARHGERMAQDPPVLGWRAKRARCLALLGLRQEAIHLLLECVDDPRADPAARCRFLVQLSYALTFAGLLTSATTLAEKAVQVMPDDLPADSRVFVLDAHARLILLENDGSPSVDRRAVRRALQLLDEVRELLGPKDPLRLLVDVQRAVGLRLIGNPLVALRDLVGIANEARERGEGRAELLALANVGILHRGEGRQDVARRVLEEAERIAVDLRAANEAFDLNFDLYQIAQGRGDELTATHHLRRCRRFHPLLQGWTSSVDAYRRIAAGPSAG